MEKEKLTIEKLEEYLSAIFFDRVPKAGERKIILGFYCNKQGLRSSDLPPCEGCDCHHWKEMDRLMKEEVKKFGVGLREQIKPEYIREYIAPEYPKGE